MSSCRSAIVVLLLVPAMALATHAHAANANAFPGIGRAATPAEVAAWDIDVRPDFKGLPPGAGSVTQGMQVWEGKCASCHGVFGESNSVFNPLVGGTTADDVRTGRVASLLRPDYPGRTTLMKLTQLSTLWDYINRAMPWNQPKSLSVQEVYAVTAYMLNLGGILPDDFTLSDRNIAQVQKRLPNRNGASTRHAMWPGRELGGEARPDVVGTACMKECRAPHQIASSIPEHARDAHGNLADQNRLVGAQRGALTARAAMAALDGGASATQAATSSTGPAPATPGSPATAAATQSLLQKNNCTACHSADTRLIGPSWAEVAAKHEGKVDFLTGKIKAGGSGAWGSIPMPAQTLSEDDARLIAQWLATGARR